MKEFKISKRVSLPIKTNPGKEHLQFVPRAFKFEDQKGLLERVAIAIQKNMPILLVGETGTGKTSLIRYLANKTNNAFRRVNHNGGTTVDDIVGKILINKQGTYWVDGVLIESMRKGYWYFADELNAASAEITFAYHSLLDEDGMVVLSENKGEVIRPHSDFRFFAAMNPAADYVGTKELNRALLSRFTVFKVNFPPPAIEKKILVNRTGINTEVAKKMINFAVEVRASQAKNKIDFVLSTRELLMWAELFRVYKKYIVSAEISILNKVKESDFDCIKDLLSLHFKGLDEVKGKRGKFKNIKVATVKFKQGDKVISDKSGKTDIVKSVPGMTDYDGMGFSESEKGFLLQNYGWDRQKNWRLTS